MSKPPLYIYLHLPKCAGSTFREHVEQRLQPDQRLGFYNTADHKLSREDVFSTVESLSREERDRLKVIYGHEVYYGLHEHFDRPVRYIMFLRDAFSHTLSFYNYHMQLHTREHPGTEDELPEFADWFCASEWVHDEMLGYLRDYGFIEDPAASLEQRVETVLDRFWFVGLTETADEEFLYLYNLIGVDRFLRNQNKSRRFHRALTDADRALIVEKSPGDVLLYREGVARNGQFHRRHPVLRRTLPLLKLKRALYRFVASLR